MNNDTDTTTETEDLVTPSERTKLIALGKKLQKLDDARDALLTAARKIIGFDVPDGGCIDDLPFVFNEEERFLNYAKYTRARWELEDATKQMASVRKELRLREEDTEDI